MKMLRLLICCLLFSPLAFAQKYWSENEVALILKEKNKDRMWVAPRMETFVDLENNEITLRIDAYTFRPTNDTLRNMDIIDEQNCPTIFFKLQLPFNKIDKDVSSRQSFVLTGNLLSCNRSIQVNVPANFEFMDKHLLLDFNISIEAAALGLIMPKGMENSVRLVMDTGKVMIRRNYYS